MSILYGAFILSALGLVFFVMARISSRKSRAGEGPRRIGWLMARNSERITVRSADNVRLLSEDQLKALEELDEET